MLCKCKPQKLEKKQLHNTNTTIPQKNNTLSIEGEYRFELDVTEKLFLLGVMMHAVAGCLCNGQCTYVSLSLTV